jgi:hypothetical protein
MKKQVLILILFGQALALTAAHAETGANSFKVDESSAVPLSFKAEPRRVLSLKASLLKVRSHVALVFDEQTQRPIYDKHGIHHQADDRYGGAGRAFADGAGDHR